MEQSQEAIVKQCDSIKEMLLEKNAAYGDSALDPIRIFSRADNVQQIENRIDDKLSRLKRGHDMPDESRMDTIRDLIGYLVLLLIAVERSESGRTRVMQSLENLALGRTGNGRHSARFPSLEPPDALNWNGTISTGQMP